MYGLCSVEIKVGIDKTANVYYNTTVGFMRVPTYSADEVGTLLRRTYLCMRNL